MDKFSEQQQTHPEIGMRSPEIGMRAWYLEEAKKLEHELGFSTSNFTTIPADIFNEVISESDFSTDAVIDLIDKDPSLDRRSVHPTLVDRYAQKLEPLLPEIVERTRALDGDNIIVRASPHDEYKFDHLSFAGVYKSYMPRSELDKDANLLIGTASVLAGRFTKYGISYYDRHSISSEREVGIMYMQPFYDVLNDAPLMHGTAYITDTHMRNEYVVEPPPNQLQREPRLISKRGGDTICSANDLHVENSIDFVGRMDYLLEGLQHRFRAPLDVEYLIDTNGNIFVVQIRKISQRHLSNWNNIPQTAHENTSFGSAVINSVDTIEGTIVDARGTTGTDIDITQLSDSILLINHEDTESGMHSQALLDAVRAQHTDNKIQVVIDHGEKRIRDHLQYALVEDPSLGFVAQTSDPSVLTKLSHNTIVRIESDGLNIRVS